MAAPGFTLRGGTNEILRGVVARGLKPSGPAWCAPGVDAQVGRLLVETADAAFSRASLDQWVEVDRSGLREITAVGLAEAAMVVRVSAYHGATIPFAEHALMPNPKDRERGAFMRAVQMCGAMARVRDLTIMYAAQRQQFDRPGSTASKSSGICSRRWSKNCRRRDRRRNGYEIRTHERVAAAKVITGRARRYAGYRTPRP